MPQNEAESTALALPSVPEGAIQVSKPLPDDLRRAVETLKRIARSPGTLRAYREDWTTFVRWCSQHGQRPFPVEEDTIIAFLASFGLAAKPATLKRRVATIRTLHREWDDPLPRLLNVERAIKNIARARADEGLSNLTQKRELTAEDVIQASAGLPKTLVGLRDRAVLLFGWAIGQRRADIAGLRVDDVHSFEGGLYVTIRRSKTDQEGKTHTCTVIREGGSGCPVAALEAWLRAAKITEGPLIRRFHRSGSVDRRALSGHAVGLIVKEAARRLGRDPKEYGGHSLRRGLVTTAERAGVPRSQIMAQTGHKSLASYEKYIKSSPNPEHAAVKGLLKVKETPLETTEAFGQTLVKAPKRRFEKNGKPYDAKPVIEALKAKGYTSEQIVTGLRGQGVTWAGRSVEARDI